MKLVDTFLFSEPYESDLLWIKFNIEDKGVVEWIIVENSYTFQGEYKGWFARTLIESDARFAIFKHKVKIIESDLQPSREFAGKGSLFDELAFTMEFAQRELAVEYILSKYANTAYIFISDADESLDLSTDENRAYFSAKIAGKEVIRVPRNRFWYDYDNYWLKVSISPVVSVRYLKRSGHALGKIRNDNMGHGYNWSKWICFEYSFCFDKEHILRKYASQSHTGYLKEEIERGILCNHRPVSALRQERINLHLRWWMRTEVLNKNNSPQFVRDQLSVLKTNIIPDDYMKNRQKYYPAYFSNSSPVNFVNLRRNVLWGLYFIIPYFVRLVRSLRLK